MCGVAGVLNFDGEAVDEKTVQSMTAALRHRGPDFSSIFVDENCGLGHTRLSIIDLSDAGRQPMQSSDGRFTITYNGEIYNYLDIKAELLAEGIHFSSHTDTEVVLKAFEQWGSEVVKKFNGMFAFAIWDRKLKALFLARDRYGIKPLYYLSDGRRLVFGSEVKAILRHPSVSAAVNTHGLREYLTFQNFLSDQTLYAGIKLFPAGSTATISGDNGELVTRKYWDFNFHEPDLVADPREYAEELQRLLAQAVSRNLMSDVPLGTYLSGGMDSGAIAQLAAAQLPYIHSFTCGFDLRSASGIELSYDERETAEFMSYLFKTEHYEMVLKAGDMERVMPDLVRHIEEPRVGQSYPNFYAAKLASKFVKVTMSGAGGDELFAGYPWRYYRAESDSDFEHYANSYYSFWQRLISDEDMPSALAPIWTDVKGVDTKSIFRGVLGSYEAEMNNPEAFVNSSLSFEAKTFLQGLLIVEDKVSMAHSLETRVPFLDNDLVDFAQQLPAGLKLGDLKHAQYQDENDTGYKAERYFKKTSEGKLIFRQAMQKQMPAEITSRSKQGFSAPDATWFKGESIDFVNRKLRSKNARINEYIAPKFILETLDRHCDGRENKRLLIWSMLYLEHWLDHFVA